MANMIRMGKILVLTFFDQMKYRYIRYLNNIFYLLVWFVCVHSAEFFAPLFDFDLLSQKKILKNIDIFCKIYIHK